MLDGMTGEGPDPSLADRGLMVEGLERCARWAPAGTCRGFSSPRSRLWWGGRRGPAGSLPGDAPRVSGSECRFLAFFWLPRSTNEDVRELG